MRYSLTAPASDVKLASDAQKNLLRNMVKSKLVSAGHRINVRMALKKGFVTSQDASAEITRLQRIVRA